METDDRIIAIPACLKEDITDIYAQEKFYMLDKELGTQDWNDFVKKIKMIFSDKIKIANTKWKIESFKQEKQNKVDFIIKFEALAIKTDTDDLHAIFLLKKNI